MNGGVKNSRQSYRGFMRWYQKHISINFVEYNQVERELFDRWLKVSKAETMEAVTEEVLFKILSDVS